MKTKYGGYIAVAIGVAIALGFFVNQGGNTENGEMRVFHVTLADPQNYENGIYSDSIEIDEGIYQLRFVPSGDSPKILTIKLQGESIRYNEDFTLVGTPHETGFSTYYTWEYSGNKTIKIPSKQEMEIIIDPNGNLQGPISVDIIR